MSEPKCKTCRDTGKVLWTEEAGRSTTYGSSVCACRSSLELRHGTAKWWMSKQAFEENYSSPLLEASAIATIEVPVSEDNYLLHRTEENVYYPVMVKIQVGDTLATAWSVRELAAWLNKIADRMDEMDKPVLPSPATKAKEQE